MTLLQTINAGLFYLDGGTGTILQSWGLAPGELPEVWNLTHPDKITALHRAYFEAGSHMVCANTFGANGLKYDGRDGRPTLEAVVLGAVACAKTARDTAQGGQREKFIALDLGPLGRMLQPMGDLPFEEAVALFARTVRLGAAAGVDAVMIETMNDAYETKAAVLAVKESCDLPVLVSTVYDESGKLMTGADPEGMVALLEGLGADAIGMNCSLGPDKMLELLPRLTAAASVPVIVKPNAGLPRMENGATVYDVDAAGFAATMQKVAQAGGRILGGCCGTTPEFIRAMVAATTEVAPVALTPKRRTVISSYAKTVMFGQRPVLIGERINPTGKKRFQAALRERDIGYILKEGLAQEEQGAAVLDVNVGLPEVDEPELLCECVRQLQSVSALPLQLDTSDPVAMERALRLYNGKAMINSVSGKTESMDAIFPLAKKYGGVVVCLTLDENGIPETAQGRLAVARRIAARAADYGIGIENLIFDPLALTISADGGAAQVTLETIRLIGRELGGLCSLGISNVSFGLPRRELVTAAFFTLALGQGLAAAIMNPYSAEMQRAWHAWLALANLDSSCAEYIAFAQSDAAAAQTASAAVSAPQTKAENPSRDPIHAAILHGLRQQAGTAAAAALANGVEPLTLVNETIVPALDEVGRGFEAKTLFLPQLLMSAEAAGAAFEEVKRALPAGDGAGPLVVLATVKGDIHDIGKNIVKVLLENYGYRILDLGRDVPPERILEAVQSRKVKLVGLSALMTTTVPAMAETIALLRREAPDCKVVVGGAVLTQEYADAIGADQYARTAMETVRYAGMLFER